MKCQKWHGKTAAKHEGYGMKRKGQLSQLALFEGIAPASIEKLLQVGSFLDVPKGTLLVRAKEPVTSILIQLSGKTVVYNLTHAGKRKILFIYGRGALLNEHVCNNHSSFIYCETIEKSRIFSVPVVDFLRIMESDFQLTKKILEAQERKIWRLSHQLKNTMSSIYLERKLAAKLWKLSKDFGIPKEDGIEIDVNMTITFLADMLGVPRETTSRVCSVLVERDLIKINKKRITISNPEKMAQFYKTGKIE